MDEINKDFNIPFYIFEEIVDYIELTAKGYCKCMKWDNIEWLLNCAKVNNRLTEAQVNHIKEKFNREKNKNFNK